MRGGTSPNAAGLAFTLIGAFAGLQQSFPETTLRCSTPRLYFSVPCHQKKKQNVSDLGKARRKVQLPSPQEAAAAAEATTGAHAMMSDDDTSADYEDEPDGGGGSKIVSWVQRVYEAG